MQKTGLLLSFLVLVFIVALAQADNGREIRIIDATKFKDAATNWKSHDDVATYNEELSRHHHHEVAVYKMKFMGATGYKVSYYQQENDSMRNHAFEVAEGDDCDRASYTWSKDTLVIRLFNSATQKGKTYKGYGWGRTSGMVIDK